MSFFPRDAAAPVAPVEPVIVWEEPDCLLCGARTWSPLVEAADTYPGLRVAQDNFTVLEQNLVVAKGDAAKLKIINDFLDEARSSKFLKDMLVRSKLAGVDAPPPRNR